MQLDSILVKMESLEKQVETLEIEIVNHREISERAMVQLKESEERLEVALLDLLACQQELDEARNKIYVAKKDDQID